MYINDVLKYTVKRKKYSPLWDSDPCSTLAFQGVRTTYVATSDNKGRNMSPEDQTS